MFRLLRVATWNSSKSIRGPATFRSAYGSGSWIGSLFLSSFRIEGEARPLRRLFVNRSQKDLSPPVSHTNKFPRFTRKHMASIEPFFGVRAMRICTIHGRTSLSENIIRARIKIRRKQIFRIFAICEVICHLTVKRIRKYYIGVICKSKTRSPGETNISHPRRPGYRFRFSFP